jgi:hypothetical protein
VTDEQKPYEPRISAIEFLVAMDYAPVAEDHWMCPGGHVMHEDAALETAGWPEAARELDEEWEEQDKVLEGTSCPAG